MALSIAYRPEAWYTFFLLVGTAAATLTGLFFVVFSLRLADVQHSAEIRVRARYMLLGTIVMTVGSAFALMPGQPLSALGTEILIITLALGVHTVWSLIRAAQQEPYQPSPDQIARWIGFALILLLSLGGSISLMVRHGGGFYLFAFSLLLGFTVQVMSAWSLFAPAGTYSRREDVPPQAPEEITLP